MNIFTLISENRLFQRGTLFALGVFPFCPDCICLAQQTQNSSANIQVSNSRKIADDDSEASPAPVPPPVDSRVKAIHNRIDILKEIIAKKNKESAEPKPVESEPAAEAPKAEPDAGKPKLFQPPLNPARPGPAEPKVRDNESKPGLTGNQPPESQPKPKSNPLEGLEINTSQINSLELANSLFLTRNYAQALKSYEALLIMDNSELDTAWLRCLTANCYRVQKQFTKAERLYRDVAGFKETTFPNDHAQWYLDHIARRSRIEAELTSLDNELAPFKKEKEEKK